jgi:hypothetical protein
MRVGFSRQGGGLTIDDWHLAKRLKKTKGRSGLSTVLPFCVLLSEMLRVSE